jgi:hypothetical protein
MSMGLADRVLALQAVDPFSLLRADELLTIATATSLHRFAPGHLLCGEGAVIPRLYVQVAGSAVDPQGNPMQPVLGTTILLTGKPAPFPILAGPDGYTALALPRGKFFTVLTECPTLLTGFFRMPLLGVDYRRETQA